MKTIPTIATALLVSLLVLSPALAFAAGSLTVSTDKSSYTGSNTITITGSATPAPGAGYEALITVTNPSGTIVYQLPTPIDPSTGVFTPLSFAAGGSSSWTSGTYSVTASTQGYTSGLTSFTYTCTTCGGTTSSGLSLMASATAASPLYAGQTAQVSAWVIWSTGAPAKSVTFTVWLVSPSGTAAPVTASAANPAAGEYWWNLPLASSASDGLYAVLVNASATNSGTTYWAFAQTSFTVNSQIASTSAVAALQSSLNTAVANITGSLKGITTGVNEVASSVGQLSTAVGGVSSSIGSLTTTVNGIQSGLTSLTSTVGSINTAVGQIQTSLGTLSTNVGNVQTAATNAANAASAAQSAANDAKTAIDNTSTYVLVVVVIAAITLVLELAILVRKLS
jgi:uncharacterized protein YoxC